jgi:DNA-binding NarL/FixJ family response regulator
MKSENNKSRPVIGVLIVDDHLVVRTALRALLEKQPGMVVVGEASNKSEAVALASREQPEIVVLDLCLKEESGLDLIPDLLAAAEESKIIILTAVTDPEEHQRAIRQGAMGVVSKEVSADLLIKAIERVHAGELWLNRHMTATLVKELRRERDSGRSAPEEDATAQLTCREREIIGLIGEGLKNKPIAGRLCISEATVRHHLTSILRKLEVSDRLELLIFAYRHNLVTMEREHSTARTVN